MDPIADFLTRIRNGYRSGAKSLMVPKSKIKEAMAKILTSCKFIAGYKTLDDMIKIDLLYKKEGSVKKPAITEISRVSKSGVRVYKGTNQIPRVLGGMGIVIISTPQGLLTGSQAHKKGVGGEIIARVW